MKTSSFARTKDDELMNDMLKQKILADDPMAKFITSKQQVKRMSPLYVICARNTHLSLALLLDP
jgi:hypothetical protein